MSSIVARFVRSRHAVPGALVLAFALAAPHAAPAGVLFHPSARAGAMGGASVAVPWGADADRWGNPAFVALANGFSVDVGEARVNPTTGDARHRTTSVAVSYAGFGLWSAGRPFGANAVDDHGTDPRNVPWMAPWPASPTHADEESNAFAFSACGFASSVFALTGHVAPTWLARVDAAYGRRWNRSHVTSGLSANPEGVSRDEGWTVRTTPLWRRGDDARSDVRVELAFGHALVGARRNDWEPGPQTRSDGVAAHLAWRTRGHAPAIEAPGAGAFRRALEPSLDVTLACERADAVARILRRPDPALEGTRSRSRHYGFELVLDGALSARAGYVDDVDERVTKPSWGLGMRLPAGTGGEVLYDLGSEPQAGTKRVWRHQLVLRIDPLARRRGARAR